MVYSLFPFPGLACLLPCDQCQALDRKASSSNEDLLARLVDRLEILLFEFLEQCRSCRSSSTFGRQVEALSDQRVQILSDRLSLQIALLIFFGYFAEKFRERWELVEQFYSARRQDLPWFQGAHNC